MWTTIIVSIAFLAGVLSGWFLCLILIDDGPTTVYIGEEFLDTGGTILLPEGEYHAPQFYGPEGLIRWKDL